MCFFGYIRCATTGANEHEETSMNQRLRPRVEESLREEFEKKLENKVEEWLETTRDEREKTLADEFEAHLRQQFEDGHSEESTALWKPPRWHKASLVKKLTFAEFCAAFDLGPFVPLRRACKVEDVGMTKLYEFVRDGKLHIYKNGKRSSITAQELYDRYVQRLEASEGSKAA
jgi:hypothetical protein